MTTTNDETNSTERQSTEEIIDTLRGAAGKHVRVTGDDGRIVEALVEEIGIDEPLAETRRDAPRGKVHAGLHPEDLDGQIENYGVGGTIRVVERIHGGWRPPTFSWETFEDGELTGWNRFDVERVEILRGDDDE